MGTKREAGMTGLHQALVSNQEVGGGKMTEFRFLRAIQAEARPVLPARGWLESSAWV